MDIEARKERRPVYVHTVHGAIEGWLDVNARVRTTDHLNMACRHFLSVGITSTPFPGWTPGENPVAIRTGAVMFVLEVADSMPMTDARIEANRFSRLAVHVRIGGFDVQGFMHVPCMSDPVTRLTVNKAPFIALTSASIVGPDLELATSYLAVNPEHIFSIQSLDPADTDVSEQSVFTAAGTEI